MLRIISLIALCLAAGLEAAQVRYIAATDGDGAAAVVAADVSLWHTRQVSVEGDAADHRAGIVAAIEKLLAEANGERFVKLNVVAATDDAADEARQTIRAHFPAGERPPVSYVVGRLPAPNALITIDAVIATSEHGAQVLPPGPRVYISGQAQKGATPAEATQNTLASLVKSLEFVGSTPADVVQAKCFLTPIDSADDVKAAFEKVFHRELPIVMVEWKSTLPIEIELIAKAPVRDKQNRDHAEPLKFLTPPGATPSPLFARITRLSGESDIIYTAGLYSPQSGSGEQQVEAIFEELKKTLSATGSDLRHLVKATYYVSDDDASGKLNQLRPRYYDPQRPPAASKAMVQGVGMSGRSITIDMIATPGGEGEKRGIQKKDE